MRLKIALSLLLAVLATAGIASAQSTTGTISGRVVDTQGGVLPGVTVTVESPNLQGVRTAVTTENGDYQFPLLPSGTYTVSFDIPGFEKAQRTVTVAPTQAVPLDVTLGVAGIQESVNVTAQTADVLTKTAQVAINLKQDLVATLPTTRDINAAILLAPSVHPTGPSGGYSIAGSMSFQNLFMVNGVTVNENLRGQPNDLYVEDAIQETTVASGGVSAEYGRFTGGVVNVITKSGGNLFSGSYRETLNNDKWRKLTPFEDTAVANDPNHKDTRLDDVVPTHEYTLGGPLMKDRLWFFTAGRLQTQSERRTLAITAIPYDFSRPTRRYEGKGTYSATSSHRFQVNYMRITDEQVNNTFNTSLSMDVNSLGTRKTPQDLYSVNYSGAITPSLFIEGLWSRRHFTFDGSGAKSTDIIDGTLVTDQARGGTRYWADTFCGVCTPEQRDNENVHVKASYFLSTRDAGSHNMTIGYDNFNDVRKANNHQSGSDYRILGTTSIIRGAGDAQVIYPQFLGDGTTRIQWNPIPIESSGSNFRTHAVFYNDSWRVNGRLTANLGIRFDKNHGLDQQGNLVTDTDAFSPRLGVVLDPLGDQRWSVTASFAKYVDAISNSIADAASAAGNPQTYQFIYRGADINPNPNAASLVDTAAALAQVFAWFNANGGSNLPLNGTPTIPGVTPRIGDNLKSPIVLEYAAGLNRQFGARAALRVDYVYRDWRDFYVQRTDLSTGRVTNSRGQEFDLTLIENTNDLARRYSGATFQGTYRFSSLFDVGATYTLSRLWGNVDGETVNNGPVSDSSLRFPEYKQASWNYPDGDLSADQRHRGRLWINYGVPRVSGLTLSAMQTLESGVPYGASSTSGVDPRPFVTNPGYVTPPPGTSTTYYFTARDAFRTEGQKRTDLAVNYDRRLTGGSSSIAFFVQAQVINLFNNFQLCGCGGTVFQNGGAVTQTRIDQTARTPVTNTATYATFNPFTTTPVEGVNWSRGPIFGTALNRLAWTSPRQLRLTFGLRF
jgi:outer membrane receptor for ferrienterochelin and colicin